MADKKREKLPQYTSPIGKAKWVTLNKPDTKFKKEGQFRVVLLLPPAEAKPIQEMIDKLVAEQKAIAKADPKNKGKKIKEADLPYKMDLDKEGEETGLVAFNFTARASGERQDGSKWTFRPAVFDAKGKIIPSNISIFGGSELRVTYEIEPWYTAIGAGASLRMKAVQIAKLATMGARDASSYGFGEVDGYAYEAEEGEAEAQEGAEEATAEEKAEQPEEENTDF